MTSAQRSRFLLVAAVTAFLAVVLVLLRDSSPAGAELTESAVGPALTVARGTDQDGKRVLEVEAYGLEAGVTYTVHLHGGTVDAPSASAGVLGELRVDSNPTAAVLIAHAVTFSATGEQVLLTDDLLDGKFVDLLGPSGDGMTAVVIPGR